MVAAVMSSSLTIEYSIEYLIEYSSITTITDVTLKEADRPLADYFHVRL